MDDTDTPGGPFRKWSEESLISSSDQLGADLGRFAGVLYQYYEALLGAGFSEKNAIDLTRDWQSAYYGAIFAKVIINDRSSE